MTRDFDWISSGLHSFAEIRVGWNPTLFIFNSRAFFAVASSAVYLILNADHTCKGRLTCRGHLLRGLVCLFMIRLHCAKITRVSLMPRAWRDILLVDVLDIAQCNSQLIYIFAHFLTLLHKSQFSSLHPHTRADDESQNQESRLDELMSKWMDKSYHNVLRARRITL